MEQQASPLPRILVSCHALEGIPCFSSKRIMGQNYTYVVREGHSSEKKGFLLVTQRVSNSRVRDLLGFSQSGSGLGSVCTLASGSAGFGFFVGFLYLDLSKISSRVWFGFMLKIRVRVSVCKK